MKKPRIRMASPWNGDLLLSISLLFSFDPKRFEQLKNIIGTIFWRIFLSLPDKFNTTRLVKQIRFTILVLAREHIFCLRRLRYDDNPERGRKASSRFPFLEAWLCIEIMCAKWNARYKKNTQKVLGNHHRLIILKKCMRNEFQWISFFCCRNQEHVET